MPHSSATLPHLTSAITWIPAEVGSLPDTETTVLVACSIRMSDPVWLGYYDSAENVWRSVDAEEIEVTHWADLPEPPVLTIHST